MGLLSFTQSVIALSFAKLHDSDHVRSIFTTAGSLIITFGSISSAIKGRDATGTLRSADNYLHLIYNKRLKSLQVE